MDLRSIRLYVDDRPGEGVFRVHAGAFVDPDVFELEMKYIFERTWIFLGLESQVARPNDFVTTHIGRTPVLVTRDAQVAEGALVAMLDPGRRDHLRADEPGSEAAPLSPERLDAHASHRCQDDPRRYLDSADRPRLLEVYRHRAMVSAHVDGGRSRGYHPPPPTAG